MTSPRTIYLLSRLYYAFRQQIEQALADEKVTAVQYTILSMLQGREKFSSADIARRYFVKPQSMNEMIFSLDKSGLISRHVDEHNKRILRIALTEEGERVLQRCDAAIEVMENRMLDGIPPDELAGFRGMLQNLLSRTRGDAG